MILSTQVTKRPVDGMCELDVFSPKTDLAR